MYKQTFTLSSTQAKSKKYIHRLISDAVKNFLSKRSIYNFKVSVSTNELPFIERAILTFSYDLELVVTIQEIKNEV